MFVSNAYLHDGSTSRPASIYIEALENEAVAQAPDAAEEIDDTPPFGAGARPNGPSCGRCWRGLRLHGLFHSRHQDERRHQRPHEADSSPTARVVGTSVWASLRVGQSDEQMRSILESCAMRPLLAANPARCLMLVKHTVTVCICQHNIIDPERGEATRRQVRQS